MLFRSETLFSYGPRQAIHNLQVSPNERYITGLLDNRVFILDLSTKRVVYVTGEQEQAFFPLFSYDGLHVFFSRAEQGKPVLYQYNIKSLELTKLGEDTYARYDVSRDKTFLLTSKYQLVQQSANGLRAYIAQLGQNPYYTWQVMNDTLYYTKANGTDVEMFRLNIKTGVRERKTLFKNSRRYHFNIHPNGEKMLVAKALLRQSDLVEVHWQK